MSDIPELNQLNRFLFDASRDVREKDVLKDFRVLLMELIQMIEEGLTDNNKQRCNGIKTMCEEYLKIMDQKKELPKTVFDQMRTDLLAEFRSVVR